MVSFVWTGRWWTQPLLQSQRELSRTCTYCSSCECTDPQQSAFTSFKHHRLSIRSHNQLGSQLSRFKNTVTALNATRMFSHTADIVAHADIFCLAVTMEGLQLLEMNGYWKQWWHSSNKSKVALYQCHCQSLTPFSAALPDKGPFIYSDAIMSVCSCACVCV